MEERIESLEETVEVLADKKLLASIKKSLDEIKQGKFKEYRNVNEFMAKFKASS